jgi:hypothetical protein
MMTRNHPNLPRTRMKEMMMKKIKIRTQTKEKTRGKTKLVIANVGNQQLFLSSVKRSHCHLGHRPQPHLLEQIRMNVPISSKYGHLQRVAVHQNLFRKALDPAESSVLSL